MLKWLALGIVIVLVFFGLLFFSLDVFDIDEDFRLHLPSDIINTVLIFAVAVSVVGIAARTYAVTGSPPLLWLSCGALAFGVCGLLRGWFAGQGLNVVIVSYDGAALLASVLHLIGASLCMAKPHRTELVLSRKWWVILAGYLGVLVGIALVAWLAHQSVIPPFHVPGEGPTLLRAVIRWIAIFLFLAASTICFGVYFKLRTDFHYWYSLGLVLFTFGLIFMSLGSIDSRVAWVGLASQYAGGIYLLVAVLGAYKLAGASSRNYLNLQP